MMLCSSRKSMLLHAPPPSWLLRSLARSVKDQVTGVDPEYVILVNRGSVKVQVPVLRTPLPPKLMLCSSP